MHQVHEKGTHVEIIGQVVVYIMMGCLVAGAVASMVKPGSELGNQFIEGIYSVGPIFFSVGGIFASIPYLEVFINTVFGPLYALVGADPALAATTIIASDMGGYQVADVLASTRESWIMALFTGFMAGATIVYSMPIGLRMIDKSKHKYFALGTMCGFLAIPIGVLIASGICAFTNPMVRAIISTNSEATYQLAMSWGLIFANLIPLTVICVLIAIGLKLIPEKMIKGFTVFGTFIDYAARTVLVLSIIEYFTGIFTTLFGGWGFVPLMAADDGELVRAIETCGAISMMLAGAFPMVHLVKTYLAGPLGKMGKLFHLSDMATAGILATACNALALYPMMKDMRAVDIVKTSAFTVCGAFLIGDHLSFAANFQPTLILPLFIGKLLAASIAVAFTALLALREARKLEAADLEAAGIEVPEDESAPLPEAATAEATTA